MENYEISIAVIRRLPMYYRYLSNLHENDVTRISSKELSEKMGITASQIRQDLNNFGCFGQQGYGYNVNVLYDEIKKILGLNGRKYNVIIIGGGNIGQALANYPSFETLGFNFLGIFDVNPKIMGLAVRGIEIYPISGLEEFMKNNTVDIAALTLPKRYAEEMTKRLIAGGIKGIWNFTQEDLDISDNVAVENVYLSDSLMTLSYRLSEAESSNPISRSEK